MSRVNKKRTTAEFVAAAVKVHGSAYSYANTVYVNNRTRVTITCPLHGDFKQTPNNHLHGYNCARCAGNVKKSIKEFTAEAIKKHGNKYNYSKSVYIDTKTKIEIICKKHGSFWQTPNDHISGGYGCAKCAGNYSDLGTFIQKAGEVHKGFYTYSLTDYIEAKRKVVITCPKHGDFEQTPNNHLSGNGCPTCAYTGFNPNLPAILYYLKVEHDGNTAYKIGITNRTVAQRYQMVDLAKITVISEVKYKLGKLARQEETKIKREFKQGRWQGPDLLDSGNTELFSYDVLGIDKMEVIDAEPK